MTLNDPEPQKYGALYSDVAHTFKSKLLEADQNNMFTQFLALNVYF